VFSPGHTPGHTAYLLEESKVLITGDAANISNGELIGPNPAHTFDIAEADESFEKLKKVDADFVVCYHGGLWSKS
jgi:glyoxylase-like metal-dependent hydrolase (beta-lactamase superfamily II)